MSLGTDIYARRKAARLTQGKVAKRAGIHLNTLVDFEREKAGPDKATYKHILAVITELEAQQPTKVAS